MFWGIAACAMILIELFKIFSLALITLTGIIVMAGVISEAMKNNFGLMQILGIIPLLLPSLLPYTVPTTTLFATCIVYGRLSADNEILAPQSRGRTHYSTIVWPTGPGLGVVTSVITMFLPLLRWRYPRPSSQLRNPSVGEVQDLLYMMLRKDSLHKKSQACL